MRYGDWAADLGIFTALGAAIPVGHGFAVGGAVQLPIMLLRRVSVAVSPAVFVSYRF